MSGRWRVRFAGLATVLALGTGIVLLTPAPGYAHATLVGSDPANGAQLDTSPETVELWFSERVTPIAGGIVLHDAAGDRVETEPAFVPPDAPAEVHLPVPADLADGTWVLSWRVVSADSHPVSGALVFGVGEAVDPDVNPAALDTAEDPAVAVGFTVFRWAGYAGLALFAGGLLMLVWCWPAGWQHRRTRRLLGAGWLISVAGAAGSLLLQGPYAAGRTLSGGLDPALLATTLDSDYGRYLLARLGLLAAAGGLLLAAARLPGPARTGTALLLGVTLPATWIGTGHTNTAAGPVDAVVDTVHLAAMAAWFGGLVVLAACLLPRSQALGPEQIQQPVRRFSLLATGSVIALVGTGGYIAWREVGSLDALAGTSYGRLLAFKLAVIGILLWLGALSNTVVRRRYRQPLAAAAATRSGRRADRVEREEELQARSRLRQSVRLEAVAAVAVLAVASVLVATPPGVVAGTEPAAAAGPAGPVTGRVVLDDPELVVQVVLDPPTAGATTLEITVTDLGFQPVDVPEVTASFTLPDPDAPDDPATAEFGPLPVGLERTGPGAYEDAQVTLPAAGQWRLRVAVRSSDIDSHTALVDLPVA